MVHLVLSEINLSDVLNLFFLFCLELLLSETFFFAWINFAEKTYLYVKLSKKPIFAKLI